MKNQDLEIAKRELKERSLSLVIVKDKKIIFESSSHGIIGFLQAIEKLGKSLKKASVGDRIVGKAIALLCVYTEVKAVYAETLSERARIFFEKYALHCEWDNIVEKILGANKTKSCPFEKAAEHISNVEEAYEKLKRLLWEMTSSKRM
jgi:hypothetical protein